MRHTTGLNFAWVALIAIVCTFVYHPPGVEAADEKYALVVGVRKYDPNELHDLSFSEPDAVDLAKVLKSQGYKPHNVVLMTQTIGGEDPRFAPEAGKIRKELGLLVGGLGKSDVLIVALAGHGVQFLGDQETYFCPSGAKLGDKRTLLPLREIYGELAANREGMKVLLVDACRNDPQSNNSRSRPTVQLESVTRSPLMPPGGVAAFFSCSEGEKAYEHAELGHGVFFHYVIEALRGEVAAPGEEGLLLPDLEKHVKRNVRDYVRAKYALVQMPELWGNTRGLVPLTGVSRVSIPVPKRLSPATQTRIPVGRDRVVLPESLTRRSGRRLGLLVGVEGNERESNLHLKYPNEDIRELKTALLKVGFAAQDIMTLTDYGPNRATKTTVGQYWEKLLSEAGRDDLVFFAFSGMSKTVNGEVYLLPLEARPEVSRSLISLKSDVYGPLERCPAGQKVVVIAGCGGLDDPPSGTIAMAASLEGQVARESDDLGHDVFLNFVIEGLNGQAATPDGTIDSRRVFEYASFKTRQFCKEKYNITQQPEMKAYDVAQFPVLGKVGP